MAIWSRGTTDLKGLVQSFRPRRPAHIHAVVGAVCSVGSRGDSYDNALAEPVIGLYKTELIRKRGPWRSFEQLELATARWVEWYNQRRHHSSIGAMPLAQGAPPRDFRNLRVAFVRHAFGFRLRLRLGVIERSTARKAARSAELTGWTIWFLARSARRMGLGVSARLTWRPVCLIGCSQENRQPR